MIKCSKGIHHQGASLVVLTDSCPHDNLLLYGFDASQCMDCKLAFTKSPTCVLLENKSIRDGISITRHFYKLDKSGKPKKYLSLL